MFCAGRYIHKLMKKYRLGDSVTSNFEYCKSVKDVEYYEILEMLMERWEFEIVEFKEAKGGYDTDKIGKYFSAKKQGIIVKDSENKQQSNWVLM